MRRLLSSASVLVLLWGAAATAAEPPDVVDIPLDKIWAADMPGTRNIRELEPRTPGDRHKYGPLMRVIYRELMEYYGRRGRVDAGRGFAVPGQDIAALNFAYDVLLDSEERPNVVPAGDVSLVFYARRTGKYVYLEKAQREGTVIKLQYRFAVHRTKEITAHFALISLGELTSGKYEVRMVQLPVKFPPDEDGPVFRPPLKDEIVTHIVSQPFSFEVK
jgi:hypothetical protein